MKKPCNAPQILPPQAHFRPTKRGGEGERRTIFLNQPMVSLPQGQEFHRAGPSPTFEKRRPSDDRFFQFLPWGRMPTYYPGGASPILLPGGFKRSLGRYVLGAWASGEKIPQRPTDFASARPFSTDSERSGAAGERRSIFLSQPMFFPHRPRDFTVLDHARRSKIDDRATTVFFQFLPSRPHANLLPRGGIPHSATRGVQKVPGALRFGGLGQRRKNPATDHRFCLRTPIFDRRRAERSGR